MRPVTGERNFHEIVKTEDEMLNYGNKFGEGFKENRSLVSNDIIGDVRKN